MIKMDHDRAVAMAEAIENKIDLMDRTGYELCSEEELAIYTLWRGFKAMEWATRHPIQSLMQRAKAKWMRLKA